MSSMINLGLIEILKYQNVSYPATVLLLKKKIYFKFKIMLLIFKNI